MCLDVELILLIQHCTCSANQPMCLRWGCVGAEDEAPR